MRALRRALDGSAVPRTLRSGFPDQRGPRAGAWVSRDPAGRARGHATSIAEIPRSGPVRRSSRSIALVIRDFAPCASGSRRPGRALRAIPCLPDARGGSLTGVARGGARRPGGIATPPKILFGRQAAGVGRLSTWPCASVSRRLSARRRVRRGAARSTAFRGGSSDLPDAPAASRCGRARPVRPAPDAGTFLHDAASTTCWRRRARRSE